MSLTDIFHTLSIYFSGTFPPLPDSKSYLLIAVEYFTCWTVVCAAMNFTINAVVEILER